MMKKGTGILIGLIALGLFGARMVFMKSSNEKNKHRQELSDEIRNRAKQDSNKDEYIGSSKGIQLLKESNERKEEYNSSKNGNSQLESNTSSSNTISEQKAKITDINLDDLVEEKFSPMTERDTEVNYNPSTNEVSIVFASTIPGGKKIVGSTYLIGSMEKGEEKYYFKPVKWKKEHEESSSIKEYLLTNIDYIDSEGNSKLGNLKAYWDWGFNGKKPFYFEEE